MAYVKNGQQPNYPLDIDHSSLLGSIASSIASSSITIQNALPPIQSTQIGVRCPSTGAEVISKIYISDYTQLHSYI